MAKPFFFLIDFEAQKPIICELDQLASRGIYCTIRGKSYTNPPRDNSIQLPLFEWQKIPISFVEYERGFNIVQQALQSGNTYLLNLTYPTKIDCNYTLEQIFNTTYAPYKLYLKDEFVCFSPECFIRTSGDYIYSYPMKGTMSASLPEAKNQLLNSQKELWEHYTIVDLIRNDLAMVAHNIEVKQFRYAEKITTHYGDIWQTSSEICGRLPENWKNNPLEIINKLLPAGSVSGAPKEKTCDIIKQAEGQNRGYYTGVFGIFDGENLDSAVIIRYIENSPQGLQFRSGGGITAQSQSHIEYQELLDKVYVPFF